MRTTDPWFRCSQRRAFCAEKIRTFAIFSFVIAEVGQSHVCNDDEGMHQERRHRRTGMTPATNGSHSSQEDYHAALPFHSPVH